MIIIATSCLLITSITLSSSCKEDEMINDNNDNEDKNDNDLLTLLGVNNVLVEDIEASSKL